MRDYVRGLLGPVGRKNSRQLAEYAGHTTPHGLQHLLSHSRWDADALRDDLQTYVAQQLGHQQGVFILDDTGFVPDERAFATKGDLTRDIIRRTLASPLAIAWVTADSAYGQASHFRRFLEDHDLS
nr:transposase [Streptomyces sp. NRRL B-3229]